MINDGGVHVALDALAADITHLALHDDYPGTTFANEKTDGSPATTREAVSWSSATGRTATQSGTATFDVTGTVSWITGATALTAGDQRAVWPADAAPFEFDVDPSTDVFEAIAHGFSDDQPVVFYGTSVPGALTAGVIYFMRDTVTDTFKVAATVGGAAIDITSRPSTAGAIASPITVYTGGQREFSVSGLVLAATF